MELTLELETGYEEYGNDSGMQIDTLARAVVDYTSNELETWEEEDQAQDWVLEHYDYESDFLKTLEKKLAREYVKNAEAYATDLKEYTDAIQEKARQHELETCELSNELEKAVEEVQSTNYRHFLYGDGRYTAGVIREAERYLLHNNNIEGTIKYDEKKDVITIELDSDNYQYALESATEPVDDSNEVQSWSDLADISAKQEKAIQEYIQNVYESKASANWYKSQQAKKKRQEEYAKTKAYQEERAKKEAEEKEAERIKKLQAII